MSPLARTKMAYQISRTEGAAWLGYRLHYAARLRTGRLRAQLPTTAWADHPLRELLRDPSLGEDAAYLAYRREHSPQFFFDLGYGDEDAATSRFREWDHDGQPLAEANDVVAGTVRYFARTALEIGRAPAWNVNAFTGRGAPSDQHWTEIGDFAHGDIKAIWDLSRFGFVYPLVRAYRRTSDEAYAERFWELFEHWHASNPPQCGPNWRCGQETALRLMAWSFALYGFFTAKATTAARVSLLARACAVSAERIEANIDYALSQRNNHGMSEAVGLWTVGTLFPELRDAGRWCERGRELLEQQGLDLIYSDGGFSQHSVNYHRLMLHDYLWALRLADLNGEPFSAALRERVGRAGELLYQLQDEVTGRVPYYGQNDGSLILRLTNCDYQDYRPVIQAVRFLDDGTRAYDHGPWDEELLWLFGAEAVDAPLAHRRRHDLNARQGGYYTLRGKEGFGFVRCATFLHRPGEADMLHTDVWWRGINIAADAGTYSYNATEPWPDEYNVLSQTRYHNTVLVDGQSQMERASPFLWLPWLSGRVRGQAVTPDGTIAYWEGEHDGYARLMDPVVHRRAIVRLGAEHWLVLDDLRGALPHLYRLHWLLPDLPHELAPTDGVQEVVTDGQLTLETAHGPYTVQAGAFGRPADVTVVRADEASPRGWRAPYYLHAEPALSFALQQFAARGRFWTLLGPSATADVDGRTLRCRGEDWSGVVELGGSPEMPLVRRVDHQTDGGGTRQLRITP